MNSSIGGRQTTLPHAVRLSGIGVHSGAEVGVTLRPAEADTGIVFHRSTDAGVRDIPALSSHVVSTELCTVVGLADGTIVGTVEHVMAAISAFGIDNLGIEIDGPEMPIMDGSASAFAEAFERAGLVYLDAPRRYLRVTKPVRVEMGQSWGEFLPHDGRAYEVEIDFENQLIGRQVWKGEMTAKVFHDQLSRARTFGFMRDVERLWSAGYALGASLENTLVVGDDDKVVNVEGLRYPDEFARHKVLDAVGDLALAGMPFIGRFRSYRGGHKLNAMALKALTDDASAHEVIEAPLSREQGGNRGTAWRASAAASWSQ